LSELFRTTSQYHKITVDDDQEGAITLRIGGRRQSTLDSATGLDAMQPILDYLHLPVALRPDARRALVIGLGGGVLPKRMWHDYPLMSIDVAELDPVVVDVAHRFFGLPPDDERLAVHVGDGRPFVDESPHTYDIIVVDAFFEDAMPFTFVTDEFFASAAEHLSAGGVLAYNVVSPLTGDGATALRHMLAGVRRHFAWAGLFPTGVDCGGGRQNMVMAASKGAVDEDRLLKTIRNRAGGLVTVRDFETFGDGMADGFGLITTGDEPFRDGEAPADGLLHT
jgi:spermidine synthase